MEDPPKARKGGGRDVIRAFFCAPLLAAVLSASPGSAEPLEILIDFGDGAPTPTLGGTWNSTDDGDAFLLIVRESNGDVAPGITLQTGAWTAVDTMNDPSFAWTKEWVDAKALADFVFIRGGNLSLVTIAGLPAGELFDVEVAVSAEPMGGSWIADYMVNFEVATVPPSDESSLAYDPEFDGQIQREIMRWRDVELNSRQEINISVESMAPDYQAMISAVRVVPEAGAGAMMTAAVFSLLLLRGRRADRWSWPGLVDSPPPSAKPPAKAGQLQYVGRTRLLGMQFSRASAAKVSEDDCHEDSNELRSSGDYRDLRCNYDCGNDLPRYFDRG